MEAVQPAAEAVAGHGKERLEPGDGKNRRPEPGPDAGEEEDEPNRDKRRSERLRKSWTEFRLDGGRWAKVEPAPERRPRLPEQEPLGAEGGADGESDAHHGRKDRLVKGKPEEEYDGGECGAEALSARINGANGDHG